VKSIIDKNNKKEYALIIGARGYIGNNLYYFLKKKKNYSNKIK
jgi:N-acetyl-gamma-glutamylphosphate reductase